MVQTKIKNSGKQPKDYPKLMIHEELKVVVLFEEKGVGTVVAPNNSDYQIGLFSRRWWAADFVDFNGEVELKNE